jgi:4'-phosphopantetheinyl transferase
MNDPAESRLASAQIPAPGAALNNEIHLWTFSLDVGDTCAEFLLATLSSAERDRANRFRFLADRRRFALSRGALRKLLSRYTAIPPTDILLLSSSAGRPFLANSPAPPVSFSVSHSGGMTLLAFTGARHVGVDVERVHAEADLARVVDTFFLANERALLGRVDQATRDLAAVRLWTYKEAHGKATGRGLEDASSIDMSTAGALLARYEQFTYTTGDGVWSLVSLDPHPGYVAALVCGGAPMPKLRRFSVRCSVREPTDC